MKSEKILISNGSLKNNELAGKVAIVTGAGRGIGFEAARALAWLGCHVVLAEIDESNGQDAEKLINQEIGRKVASFYSTDMGDEESVQKLARRAVEDYGQVDIILNNATIVPVGAVKDVSLENWDLSYRVNLRGLVILIQELLPGMLERNYGVIVSVSSSGAAPFMGPYEIFKMSQRELANTLAGELEDTGVIAFTIGPGLVKTPGALKAIEEIAPLYKKTVEEFFKMSENQMISAEAAGAGFAAAIALSSNFSGQEIGSIQALHAAGIDLNDNQNKDIDISDENFFELLSICKKVLTMLEEQHMGWKKRPLFERMWLFRDFTKNAGMSVEQWLDVLNKLEQACIHKDVNSVVNTQAPFDKLTSYIHHLQDLSKGYIKNKNELKKFLAYLEDWEQSAQELEIMMARNNNNRR